MKSDLNLLISIICVFLNIQSISYEVHLGVNSKSAGWLWSFYTIIISTRRRALYKDKRNYSDFKAKICGVFLY